MITTTAATIMDAPTRPEYTDVEKELDLQIESINRRMWSRNLHTDVLVQYYGHVRPSDFSGEDHLWNMIFYYLMDVLINLVEVVYYTVFDTVNSFRTDEGLPIYVAGPQGRPLLAVDGWWSPLGPYLEMDLIGFYKYPQNYDNYQYALELSTYGPANRSNFYDLGLK